MGGIYSPASFTNPAAFSLRDEYMVGNAIRLYDRMGSNGKLLLSAHNAHIAEDPSYSLGLPHQKNMGAYLRGRFKTSYLKIGMSFYQGSFLAFYTRSIATFTVGTPRSTTYNYTLGNVGLSQYILDLRSLLAGALKDWAQGPRPFRLIGVSYDPTMASDFYYTGPLQQWFDFIINFQNTTAVHYLS